MNDEDAFLKSIKASPDDDTARLAYADWLDEHGLHRHAAYLREVVAMARDGPGHPAVWNRRVHRLLEMRIPLAPGWIGAVHCPRLDRAFELAERAPEYVEQPYRTREEQLRWIAERFAEFGVGHPLFQVVPKHPQPFGLRLVPKPNRKERRARRN